MELFEQTTLGSMTLKNRIFRSATNEHLAEPSGRITEDLIRCYEELAAGGAGVIISGHYCVVTDARTSIDQAAVCANSVEDLKPAADRVHAHGAKLIMQISHGGMGATEAVNGRTPIGVNDLSAADLEEIKALFVTGARKAQAAGWDGVQVHLAHGYLLSDFVDPFHNKRTDEYGGCTANRMRFPMEIVRAIREACGSEFTILVKINADASEPCDYVPELRRVFESLQAAGVDAAEVSGLSFSKKKATIDEPYFLREVLEAGRGLDLPIILVGGLDSRRKLDEVLAAGIPYVSLSRSLICMPDFVNHLKDGEEKSPCLRCNGCFRVYKTRYVRCALHREEIPRLRELYGSTENKE